MTFSIMIFSIIKHSILTFSIMTFTIKTFNIVTSSLCPSDKHTSLSCKGEITEVNSFIVQALGIVSV
jgi:hypothetical protein